MSFAAHLLHHPESTTTKLLFWASLANNVNYGLQLAFRTPRLVRCALSLAAVWLCVPASGGLFLVTSLAVGEVCLELLQKGMRQSFR
jgi:hypothetical protein